MQKGFLIRSLGALWWKQNYPPSSGTLLSFTHKPDTRIVKNDPQDTLEMFLSCLPKYLKLFIDFWQCWLAAKISKLVQNLRFKIFCIQNDLTEADSSVIYIRSRICTLKNPMNGKAYKMKIAFYPQRPFLQHWF